MNAPQIIWIVLATISGTIHLINHGKPMNVTYSFFGWIYRFVIFGGLLVWGGFFG